MTPDSAQILYLEPKIGVPFGLMLCFGTVLSLGIYWLRPWPPQRKSKYLFASVAVLGLLCAALLLLQRAVMIDTARSLITESRTVLGIGPSRTWPFSAVRAVVVSPDFRLGIEIGEEPLLLWQFSRVLIAEDNARHLASLLEVPAQRQDYRLDVRAHGGDMDRFELQDGRQGLSVALDSMVQVHPADGERDQISPAP